ncbi:MAG: putative porin [Candidatus Omnitrophica bacterium]|nr:putative porin [Candidatus Omnitrophota bacterium]MCF7894503.1 putative porin [Candidatus Omnitrophota bacterium]
MKKFPKFMLALAFALSFFFATNLVFAGEIDVLVEKLVEKGILTKAEATQVVTEAKDEARKEAMKGTYAALPSWIQNLKLKGDLRLRYQWEDKTGADDRHRGRYRFRLGLESKVNDKLTVAAGLATGGSDGRSTNQTMDDSFSTPDIRLDYAYAQWQATPWMTLRGGKVKSIKKEIFRPSDLMWDSDLHPEGLTIALTKDVNGTDFFMNNGFWVLGESKTDVSDPVMWVVQPGFSTKLADGVKLSAAVAGYFFDNVKGSSLNNGGDDSGSYNSLDSDDHLKYEYNVVSPSMKLSVKKLFGVEAFNKFTLFGDYVYNPDPSDEDSGYLVGAKMKFGGPMKLFGKKWTLGYSWRHLEKDAWLDIFPDSDAYGGHTDVEGHEVKFSYPLGKHTSLGLDYYLMKIIQGSGRRHVFQVDWKMKF